MHPRRTPILLLSMCTLALLISDLASASANDHCVAQYSTKDLCVLPSANMSRVKESPEVLQAARVVAMKLRPYLPPGVPYVKLTMGYRTPEEQERIIRTGVRAGPSSGPFVSAHIYGVALDVEVDSQKNLGRQMCAALNQILPMLKNKGGVIMEGSGGGSTNGHIDDNWGKRFSMEKFGVQKSLNYTGPECVETFGVQGASAVEFAAMAKITEASLGGGAKPTPSPPSPASTPSAPKPPPAPLDPPVPAPLAEGAVVNSLLPPSVVNEGLENAVESRRERQDPVDWNPAVSSWRDYH